MLFHPLLHLILNLLVLAMDIVLLFALVRLLRRGFSNPLLVGFDRAGKLLVEVSAAQAHHWYQRCFGRRLTREWEPVVVLVICILVVRLPLGSIAAGMGG